MNEKLENVVYHLDPRNDFAGLNERLPEYSRFDTPVSFGGSSIFHEGDLDIIYQGIHSMVKGSLRGALVGTAIDSFFSYITGENYFGAFTTLGFALHGSVNLAIVSSKFNKAWDKYREANRD
jgi:hypothetical protein|tara:strand:- start:341 stop:706 length:366 start_codon:yes stop_codon:yes gene_type:complete